MRSRTLVLIAMASIALVGVLNAGYLSYTALTGIPTLCTITHGCDIVAASPYSHVFGVPLALLGVFFYSVVTLFALWGVVAKTVRVGMLVLPITTLGFLLSLYFLYLQALVIEAYCQYCLFSLFDATMLFALSLEIVRKERRISASVTELSVIKGGGVY